MKKTITIMISFLAIMSFTTSAWAATWSTSPAGGGGSITVGGTTDGFSFAVSPGVVVDGDNTDIAYTIVTGNAKAGTDAIGYSVCSGSGGVAQLAIDLDATSTSTGAGITTVGSYADGYQTK